MAIIVYSFFASPNSACRLWWTAQRQCKVHHWFYFEERNWFSSAHATNIPLNGRCDRVSSGSKPILDFLSCLSNFVVYMGRCNNTINDIYQVFHWPWLCEHEDTKVVLVLRVSNAIISLTIWITWIANPTDVVISSMAKISVVQVDIMTRLHTF